METNIRNNKKESCREPDTPNIWGGSGETGVGGLDVQADNAGSVYVTGRFLGTVDFDPGINVDEYTTDVGNFDIYT